MVPTTQYDQYFQVFFIKLHHSFMNINKNKQSYLKFLTNKMAQIFIILYLIPEPQNLIRWGGQLRLERGGEQRIRERLRRSSWRLNSGDWRLERGGEHRLERKVRFLGIWVVLFILICDFFVVNILDRICSLSGWFLVNDFV